MTEMDHIILKGRLNALKADPEWGHSGFADEYEWRARRDSNS
jgi:hypothetical protein